MTYEEYRRLQKAAYDRVNWSSRESIRRYNEYCRDLRRRMAEERDRQEEPTMTQTDAQRRAALAYRKKAVTQLNIALYPADQDIIDHLAGMESKAAYVRELIRRDMEKKDA